ncbi:hypothetical protein [Flavobacterium reichenbachii]|uniref:Uncharacterized protein n=1 Tax=Flavobacterium reichenbachii TaxID=362418 RepID=A0A085ZFI0_9FLAO|nr:hypothetical protein [Flavobacterium reichenbachii]KFF03194.1 hypothetical protein IW19_19970 [Flavobacterium reichenbachii]OXB15172.1 hypothetical protein B0A68_10605 [Flavobacterium reichenbachii]
MKFGILLAAFLFLIISSCKSSKSVDFKESIDQSQHRAFEIILGKEHLGKKTEIPGKRELQASISSFALEESIP